jgi:hypothetical protein
MHVFVTAGLQEYYRAIAAEVGESKRESKYGLGEKANRAVGSSSSEGGADGAKVLLLRGLPYKAEKGDIVEWFASVAALGADE